MCVCVCVCVCVSQSVSLSLPDVLVLLCEEVEDEPQI